ncbi:hypothetical protein SARC_17658, partial [Sphaeroforma arctica JP610]
MYTSTCPVLGKSPSPPILTTTTITHCTRSHDTSDNEGTQQHATVRDLLEEVYRKA